MKHLALTILLLALLSELPLAAQTSRQRMGAYAPGMTGLTPAQAAAFEKGELYRRYKSVTNRFGGQVYASINGKIYNMVTSGEWVSGKVDSKENGILLLERFSGNYIAVKNYSGDEVRGETVNTLAIRDGNYDQNGIIPHELWDCGKPLTPEQARRQQIEDDKALATIETAKADKAKAAQAKVDAAKAASLKWNQEQADKGDSYGLLRMGERYRDGDGVEKDLAKAEEYLAKASAAGSSAATDALEKLKQNLINSPTAQ